jgi:hypothetical protein
MPYPGSVVLGDESRSGTCAEHLARCVSAPPLLPPRPQRIVPWTNLLEFVLETHGGLARWSQVNTLSVHLSVRSPFWGLAVAVNPWMRSLYDPQVVHTLPA